MREARSTRSIFRTDARRAAEPRGKRPASWARLLRAAFMAASALFFGACSLWPQAPADETVRHLIDGRSAIGAQPPRDLVLALAPPRAAPGFDTTAMAYLRQPHALDHYATHEWADTPAHMLAPLLMRTIEDTRGFRAVVPEAGGLAADLQLDTEIVLLRQSFLAKPSRVEFTLRAQLVDLADRQVLATRYIEVTEDAPSDDAPGGVVATNAAVARALAQVASFCVEASAGVSSRSPPAR